MARFRATFCEPCSRLDRYAGKRPRAERCHCGVLHCVLGYFEGSGCSYKCGEDARALVTDEPDEGLAATL